MTGSPIYLKSLGAVPIVLSPNSTERMRLHADGNVSVGSTSNYAKLFAYGSADSGTAVYGYQLSTVEADTTQTGYGFFSQAIDSVAAGKTNGGGITGSLARGWNFGPGTSTSVKGAHFTAGNYFDKVGNVVSAYGVLAQVEKGAATATMTNGYGVYSQVGTGSGGLVNGYGLYVVNTLAQNDWGIYQAGADDDNYFAGVVSIGTATPAAGKKLYVVGDVEVVGSVIGTNIRANYQDLAEWVPSAEDLTPGMVVVLDKRSGNTVKASIASYDTSVAGVVSAQPGIILGVEGMSKEQIATTGRVRVRVDASKGSIEIGDLLVTSDLAGTAMKSAPIDIGGFSIHRPGTIIGKALEPLKSGTGEILVLLSLQ